MKFVVGKIDDDGEPTDLAEIEAASLEQAEKIVRVRGLGERVLGQKMDSALVEQFLRTILQPAGECPVSAELRGEIEELKRVNRWFRAYIAGQLVAVGAIILHLMTS